VTTRFVDLSVGAPDSSALAFSPPQDARVRTDDVVDLADAANRFASRVPPPTLAGLRARKAPAEVEPGAVGLYGRGPTVLLAIPLWHRVTHRIRDDLRKQPGMQELDEGILVAAPPVRLLLADSKGNDDSWLLAGTVTREALVEAAHDLAAAPSGRSPG
jgi:hypothetical protein